MPTVEEAMIRLERELNFAKSAGVLLIRIIHGYGSSGVGGDIRNACLRFLKKEKEPQLKQSHKTDRKNPGITFVEL
ncbi:MAG: hypothetical protein XE04_1932 [Marinimicrobia bacterium 46_43]|nr:MAG: hypothetical protein XE04_1932 [Marinimicrobia bacterium 46_43]